MSRIPMKVALAFAAVATLAGGAQAQAVYRIVGPDGKVTFSDQPPPPSAAVKSVNNAAGRAGGTSSSPALPYELQQVVGRYPVTLYTGPNCEPCITARNMLTNRGVPFTERTVNTNEDIDALQRISGDTNLPFGTIGGQQLKGFSDVEWTQFLDAAGYPKTSQLPANFRVAAATPLVAAKAAPAPAAPQANAAPAAPAAAPRAAPAPAPSNTNPTGITF
jgi:glutaredoxin